MLRSAPSQRALGIVVALFCGSVLASATPPPRPRVDPRTGKFQLADGRTADFRGACVTESSGEQDVPGLVSLSDEKLRWFADLGLNTLRVGVHWSLYETAPRVYNETYLAEIVALFGRLHTHGLWAIVDMHQDQWSGYYCAGHGVPAYYAAPPATAVYGAGGARAYPQPIAPPSFGNASQPPSTQMDCKAFMRAHHGSAVSLYTYALGAATQRMYDEPALQAAFGVFWAHVAVALRPAPNVLAFELVNEPWYGAVKLKPGPEGVDGWQLDQPTALSAPSLMRFHAALHRAIRAVDDDTLLLFEPGAGGAAYLEPTNYTEGPGGEAYNNRQAFAYHVYCPAATDGHQWGGAPPPASPSAAAKQIAKCDASTRAMVAMRTADAKLAGSGGAAMVTEFGQTNNDTIGVAALRSATDAYEAAGHGWTIWSMQFMNYLQEGGVPGSGLRQEAPPPNWLWPLARTFADAVGGEILSQYFNVSSADYTLCFAAAASERVRRLNSTVRFAAMRYPDGPRFKVVPATAGTMLVVAQRLVFVPAGTLGAGQKIVVTAWSR